MKNLLILAALLASAAPIGAQPAAPAAAESKLAHSSASVMVEPKLDDGRLVVKVAVLNRTREPVAFGPASISVAKPNGQAIALLPLQHLVDDVQMAAGMELTAPQANEAPTAGAYAAPQMTVNTTGHLDVSGYTGSSAIAGDEIIRRSNQRSRAKPTISKADAERQIAALKLAILQDGVIQPGQVAAGQIVSEKLKFAKGEDRTVQVRVRIAGDEHGFTVSAPAD
jgi:hypothetical protein